MMKLYTRPRYIEKFLFGGKKRQAERAAYEEDRNAQIEKKMGSDFISGLSDSEKKQVYKYYDNQAKSWDYSKGNFEFENGISDYGKLSNGQTYQEATNAALARVFSGFPSVQETLIQPEIKLTEPVVKPIDREAIKRAKLAEYAKAASQVGLKTPEDIKSFQRYAVSRGFNIGSFGSNGVDGVFGPKTQRAWEQYSVDYSNINNEE